MSLLDVFFVSSANLKCPGTDISKVFLRVPWTPKITRVDCSLLSFINNSTISHDSVSRLQMPRSDCTDLGWFRSSVFCKILLPCGYIFISSPDEVFLIKRIDRFLISPWKHGVVRWCEGVVYLTSLGRPTDYGLLLGKACYPCSR